MFDYSNRKTDVSNGISILLANDTFQQQSDYEVLPSVLRKCHQHFRFPKIILSSRTPHRDFGEVYVYMHELNVGTFP